jgi:3-oxoacyl-[acyl-carrier protein] reductase
MSVVILQVKRQKSSLYLRIDFMTINAKLALVDLDETTLAYAAKLCIKAGGEARYYDVNVSDESVITKLYTDVVKDFGTLDGSINNAGITCDGLLVNIKNGKVVNIMELKDWQSVIDIDLTGVFLCGREAAAMLIELGKPGLIINISSICRAGSFGQTSYSAAKAGVTNTSMVANMKPESLDKVKNSIPLRRLAEPDEIALTSLFLFENDHFTGRVIEVDGVCTFTKLWS